MCVSPRSCIVARLAVRVAAIVAVTGLSFGFVLTLCANSQETPAGQAAQQVQPVATDSSFKAHAALEAGVKASGLKVSGLAGDGVKPWHLKLDYQLMGPGTVKQESGTMEEWSIGPYQWRRVYTGTGSGETGTEWSVSRSEQYQSSSSRDRLDSRKLELRVARPVVDPLFQAGNIKSDYEMALKRVNAGVTLDCVSIVNPGRYSGDIDPELLFPTACFDDSSRLRLTSSLFTIIQFSNYQPFEDRSVAREIRVALKGAVVADVKVTLLEELAPADAELLKPGKDAIAEPYEREPNDPLPVPVYQASATVPLTPDGKYYKGTQNIAVVIQKDGSVKVLPAPSSPAYDAVQLAVKKWRYKPYTVDGRVVELATNLQYPLDMKPFIPEYDRKPAEKVVTAPGDFSSAYDPKREAHKDLEMAIVQARQEHKRILMVVGGDSFPWCKYMDQFFATHPDVRELRDANFVLLKVNVGPSNPNEKFLAQFPPVSAYPHFFVLDSDKKLQASDDTDQLQKGNDSYSAKDFKDFFLKWKTP